MKKIFLQILFILMFSNVSISQTETWKILTIARNLTSINFISPTKALVFGNDIMYRSTNAGYSWMLNTLSTPLGNVDHVSLIFVDSMYGWSLKSNNSLFKTSNGGNSWNVINFNLDLAFINGIHFINRNTGWITGVGNNHANQIAKSTNGGINWIIINSNLSFSPGQIYMLNENKGFVIAKPPSQSADKIGITYNGGIDWVYQIIGNGSSVKRLFFLDSLKGWALGNPGFVSRTSNGGMNWTFMPNSIGNTSSLFIVDSLNGWITEITGGSRIWRTTNGGSIWLVSLSLQPVNPRDVNFKDLNTGWVSIDNGALLKTTNGGLNWDYQISPQLGYVHSIDFIDINTGWVLSGDIWKTTDRGFSWIKSLSNSTDLINSLDFADAQTGFACGDIGKIYKTTNGGNNWNSYFFGSSSYSSICFTNSSTGYACGSGGSIIKTTNGGSNWVNQNSNITQSLNDINFVDAQNGFIAADGGYILKTINGGDNWIALYPFANSNYSSLFFVNSNTGVAIGNIQYSGPPYPVSNRIVIKTSNGGLNWTRTINENIAGYNAFNDVFFLNSSTGWIVFSNDFKGYISKTTDGGDNWFQTFGPIGAGSGNPGGLYCVFSLGENSSWAGGLSGTLLSTSSPIGIQIISSEIPRNFVLSQNYPNPFNPQTKIKFDVPKNVKGQTSNVKLVIYDLLGREVATLVNEELKPGTYEADWDASNFSSGVYFYKIISDEFTETRKMVLMK